MLLKEISFTLTKCRKKFNHFIEQVYRIVRSKICCSLRSLSWILWNQLESSSLIEIELHRSIINWLQLFVTESCTTKIWIFFKWNNIEVQIDFHERLYISVLYNRVMKCRRETSARIAIILSCEDPSRPMWITQSWWERRWEHFCRSWIFLFRLTNDFFDLIIKKGVAHFKHWVFCMEVSRNTRFVSKLAACSDKQKNNSVPNRKIIQHCWKLCHLEKTKNFK